MSAIPPGSTIGILGGGQLGRMLASAAAQLGYRAAIFAPEADSVAAEVAATHIAAAWDDAAALSAFATACDVVTFEWENVPLAAVAVPAVRERLAPSAKSLEIAQDRLHEKGFAAALGLAVPRHAEVTDDATLAAAIAAVGAPAILKTARDGYDGKGQARVDSAADAAAAWAELGHARAIMEQRITFLGEFSVIVARGQGGDMRHWPAPRNRHDRGILQVSECPAPDDWAGHIAVATEQARAIADALDHVGVLAVEFFVTPDGPMFNEIAPRVHNSGHWTIEGAVTCQFENHIRAICGLPLGDTGLRDGSVIMRNLIGDDMHAWPQLLADPACKLHLYGKGAPTPARKMGHATWVGASPR